MITRITQIKTYLICFDPRHLRHLRLNHAGWLTFVRKSSIANR